MTNLWHRSPHDVDPLSWFSGPLVPIVFGGLAMAFGLGVTVTPQLSGTAHWVDWAALGFLFLGFLSVGWVAYPRPGWPRLATNFLPISFGWVSLVLSTLGHLDGTQVLVELWWAPIGLSFLVAAMAPYSTAYRLLIVGGASSVFTCAVIGLIPFNHTGRWPLSTEILIGSAPVFVATAASSVFAYQVVLRIGAWASLDPGSSLTSGVLAESAKLRILRDELTSVSSRVMPLLKRVAEHGVITEEDRVQARTLSEEVRSELVERANRSWLDTLAFRLNLTILDAEHRADLMNSHQRAALLGLLQAATGEKGDARAAVVIQLRGEPDGSTAVALSTDVHFPEGRRVTLLAPHYFSLKATVDGLVWTPGEHLRMRFRLLPETKE